MYIGVRCISFYSYIKPQPGVKAVNPFQVVYRSIPTSNRNFRVLGLFQRVLYIVLFLHQTATVINDVPDGEKLYIVLFLHQTATLRNGYRTMYGCISFYSYIKPQLISSNAFSRSCCISFYSYIKPQLQELGMLTWLRCISFYSYIKPQLCVPPVMSAVCCISFYSYIKPQPYSLNCP